MLHPQLNRLIAPFFELCSRDAISSIRLYIFLIYLLKSNFSLWIVISINKWKRRCESLKKKNIIENEAPGGDLKAYWFGGGFRERRRERERAQVGRGEECRTTVNRAWQMTWFFSRFANKLKTTILVFLFITNKQKLKLKEL